MIKYFENGKKGGCIIATDRNEAYDKLNEKFAGNIYSTEEDKTVAGWTRISFVLCKQVEPSESVKKLLEAVK